MFLYSNLNITENYAILNNVKKKYFVVGNIFKDIITTYSME
jgi:hypothetical protein